MKLHLKVYRGEQRDTSVDSQPGSQKVSSKASSILPRILLLWATPDSQDTNTAVMNTAFSAHRDGIKIDCCSCIGGPDTDTIDINAQQASTFLSSKLLLQLCTTVSGGFFLQHEGASNFLLPSLIV